MTTFYAVQNDNDTVFTLTLEQGRPATAVNLTTASSVTVHASNAQHSFSKLCTFTADTTGAVSCTLTATELANDGVFRLEWQVAFADGTVATFPTPGYDALTIRPEVA